VYLFYFHPVWHRLNPLLSLIGSVVAIENAQSLVKTLDFQLNIQNESEALLREANFEARNAYNEALRLAKEGIERSSISERVTECTNLVKNTTQRIVAKALTAFDNNESREGASQPCHQKETPFPLRANYGEGYSLSITDGGEIEFRISTEPYQHVVGTLSGGAAHRDVLKAAIEGEEWSVGTAEALFRGETPELHVSVSNTERQVRDSRNAKTVIGVDVNEDNVALAAICSDSVRDSLVIDFPEVKFTRHRYFTIRKRIQSVGKDSVHDTLAGQEQRFVRDRLHKISRQIVEWSQQFERPCIVFEDLKDMRDGLDFGTRMNRRLHHIPFRTLQFYASYKAAFEGIPTAWINPEYTSQTCPLCGHAERSNRNKRRFKCRDCEYQDHADRCASVNIGIKGIAKHQNWNVPALNSLPQVEKVRRQASGAVDAPAVTHETTRGSHTEVDVGVSE
jgi:putative transposase